MISCVKMMKCRGCQIAGSRSRGKCRAATPWWIVVFLLPSFVISCPGLITAASQPLPGDTSKSSRLEAGTPSLGGVPEQRFRIRQTTHFSIAYDTAESAVAPLCGTVEEVFDSVLRFCQWSGLDAKIPRTRLPILFFDRLEDFTEYGRSVDVMGASIAGFYHHETNIAAFCHARESPGIRPIVAEIERMEAQMPRRAEGDNPNKNEPGDLEDRLTRLRRLRHELSEQFNRIVIRHETAHQVLYNLGIHQRGRANPLWLTEGLACQFEVPQDDANGALTNSNSLRLADMREALGARKSTVDHPYDLYTAAIRSGRLMNTGELVTVIRGDWRDPLALRYYYGQSSSLVDYLNRRFPKEFRGYVRRWQRNMSTPDESDPRPLDVFQQFFGDPSEQFDRAWMSDLMRSVPADR